MTLEDLHLKNIKLKILSLLLSGIMISAFGGVPSALSADVKRIALLPFKINAEKDLSFLRDGIFDMLSTRLSKEGQVEVLSRGAVDAAMQSAAPSGTVNEAAARSIGTRLNADFVLFGSLTVLGENVSIDAKMVDISGNQPTMSFFDQSNDLGAVITKINLMAVDINDKMFGRQTQTVAQAPAAAQPKPAPPNKADIYAHPENVLKEDGFIDHSKQAPADATGIIAGTSGESQLENPHHVGLHTGFCRWRFR